MRQLRLWSVEDEIKRLERWERLPKSVRSELVEQLVRIVVNAVVTPGQPRNKGGQDGAEGKADPRRA